MGTFTPGRNFTGVKMVLKKKKKLAQHVFASHVVQRLAAHRPISYSERSIAGLAA